MNRRARRAAARQLRRAETVLTSQERPTTAETHVARPTTVQTDVATVQQLMTSALSCHRAGKFIEAENLYREIIAIDPNHIGGLHNLGLIEYQRGQHEAAVSLIGRAVAANNQVADCHNSLGIVLCALGRLDEVISDYKKALSLDPRHAEALNNLGKSRSGKFLSPMNRM